MNLTLVGLGQRKIRLQLEDKTDGFQKSRGQHLFQLAREKVEIERDEAGIGLTRGSEELLDQRCAAANRIANHLDRFRHAFRMFLPLLQTRRVTKNDSENIIEI